MRNFLFIIIVVLSITSVGVAAERWHVIVLDSDDCAKLDDAEIKKTLQRSQEILKQTLNVDVEFKIEKRMAYRKFFDAQTARIAPYESPAFNPYDKDERFLMEVIERQIKARHTIEQVRKWWPKEPHVKTLHDAAKRLADAYLADIERVKQLKDVKGRNLVTDKTWQRYSVSHLGERLHSMDWSNRREVYLLNVPIIDTAPQAFAARDIHLGAVVNSFGLHASNKVVVSTFKVTSNNLRGGNRHIKKFSIADRRHAISYLVAQTIARTSLQLVPKDEPPSGLLRPFASLNRTEDFTQIAAMQPGRNTKKDAFLYHRSGAFKILLRQEIFHQQQAWEKVVNEAAQVFELQTTNEETEQIARRANRALKRLEGN